MDVAFVSEFSENRLVFRAVEGDAESFGWQEGASFPIDESYCKRVIDGRIPQVVPDAKREDSTKDLRVTSGADIGSYCAVPLVLSDGRLYGTLCCVSHEPDPWLRERDLGVMERTARWLVEQLDPEGYITTWNEGAQRIKGYEAGEIVGEHFSIFYTDEDVERGHPDEELRVAAAEGSYEEEGLRVHKDGSTFWANVLITALWDEEGELRGFAKVTRDTTAQGGRGARAAAG